jgi:hypothetical protein
VHERQGELQTLFNELCDVVAGALPATPAVASTSTLESVRERLLGDTGPALVEEKAAVVVDEVAARAK